MAGPWFTVQEIGKPFELKEDILISDGKKEYYTKVTITAQWIE